MGKSKEVKIKESILDLKKLKSQQGTLSKQKRVLCLIHILECKFKTKKELSTYLGVSIRTQERWLSKYRIAGLESMLTDKPKNKGSKIITKEIHQGLALKVNNSKAPFLGYWDAENWVYEQYGIRIKYHNLRKYLIKHFRTKLKVPRKSHYKKEEQAIEAFLKTT